MFENTVEVGGVPNEGGTGVHRDHSGIRGNSGLLLTPVCSITLGCRTSRSGG
jgi:hypothetical protein